MSDLSYVCLFRLLDWTWWMTKVSLKDAPQNTCPHRLSGPMYSIQHFHTMCITVTLTSTR